MARWTSISWNEFGSAFRRGKAKGKLSWPVYLFQLVCGLPCLLAVNTLVALREHELTQQLAISYVRMISVDLLLLVFCLIWVLRKDIDRKDFAFDYAFFAGVGAAFVLLLCCPKCL